jgi:hypothetical protein
VICFFKEVGDDLSGAALDNRAWQSRSEIREKLFWLCADACLAYSFTSGDK